MITIKIKQGTTGLWYGTTDYPPYKGLLIAEKTPDDVLDAISPTIKALRAAYKIAMQDRYEKKAKAGRASGLAKKARRALGQEAREEPAGRPAVEDRGGEPAGYNKGDEPRPRSDR